LAAAAGVRAPGQLELLVELELGSPERGRSGELAALAQLLEARELAASGATASSPRSAAAARCCSPRSSHCRPHPNHIPFAARRWLTSSWVVSTTADDGPS